MRFYLTLLLMLVLFLIAFVFGSQNNELITLNYMIAKTELTIAQAVTLFTTIGIGIGVALSMLWSVSRRIKQRAKKVDG